MGKTAVLLLLIHPSLASKTSLDALQKLYFLCFKKNPAYGGSSSKSIKVQLTVLLNNVSNGSGAKIHHQNLYGYPAPASKPSVCGNNLRLIWPSKSLKDGHQDSIGWPGDITRQLSITVENSAKTMCVFDHRDNQTLNSPGVCAADSWLHQGPIERKKEKSGTQPIVSST